MTGIVIANFPIIALIVAAIDRDPAVDHVQAPAQPAGLLRGPRPLPGQGRRRGPHQRLRADHAGWPRSMASPSPASTWRRAPWSRAAWHATAGPSVRTHAQGTPPGPARPATTQSAGSADAR